MAGRAGLSELAAVPACHGHEVWYVEDDPAWPYDPTRNTVVDDAKYATNHLANSMRIGLPNQWAYRIAGLEHPGARSKNDELASCDALPNIVGATDLREEHMRARCASMSRPTLGHR
jgi:hypothetical protein